MKTEHYQDGTPCQCDSMERTYYESGELEFETPYVNGVIHGKQIEYEPFEKYNPNPSKNDKENWVGKWELPFENGQKHGIGYGFYHTGIIAIENRFENDCWIHQKVFYPSGSIKSEVAYQNEQMHGLERVYHESGDLSEEVPYENGKIHGTRVIHHRKETLNDGWQIDGYSPYDYPDAPEGTITRITYSNGIRDGLETTHFADGTLMYEVEWKDGRRTGMGKTYNPDGTLLKETVYMYGEGIYGYDMVDTYASGEITSDMALNYWFMPRGRRVNA